MLLIYQRMVRHGDVFEAYLKTKLAAKGTEHTHTRIGSKELKLPGGSYAIQLDDQRDLLDRYYDHVWTRGNQEYLTERQLVENGPVLVDIDLRYMPEIDKRQHSDEHLLDAVVLYADKFLELYEVPDQQELEVYVLQKKNVNRLDSVTKDGVHLIFGVQMHKAVQCLVRSEVMGDLAECWDDLPIINTWDEVLDEGVAKGQVNWQLYGSRKPGNEAYALYKHYTLVCREGEWEPQESSVEAISIKDTLPQLSARYTDWPAWDVQSNRQSDVEKALSEFQSGPRRRRLVVQPRQMPAKTDPTQYLALLCAGQAPPLTEHALDEILEELYADTEVCDYSLKETHQYTMCLPETYYGPGSYTKWIRVGWALANCSRAQPCQSQMFFTWLKFSSQGPCRNTLRDGTGKFDWRSVGELYETWRKFDFNNPEGLTNRSIMYWARQHAPAEYEKVRMSTVHFFIDQSVSTATEFDLACVLFHMYKHKYVCASIKNNVWYEYANNRWREIDSGTHLRKAVSEHMHHEYMNILQRRRRELDHMEAAEANEQRNKVKKLAEIMLMLKRTNWKNNIMREAKELFYDRDFIQKLDQNPFLLCFTNCVVDFQAKCHRKGQPDDYISKCTQVPYTPYNPDKDHTIKNQLDNFMAQLFPNPELRGYMWEHLASSLVGTTDNQTFNQYTGTGRNGKSKLVEFMSKCLGDYKGTVPITLITQKRNSIGSTSSEVAQLMGVRYAVMQEPSEADEVNEGILKEITGGDPIQARALFKDSVTFNPQFNLVVCTNHPLTVKSNDDGTWRRMRTVPFESKFLANPGEDPLFPLEDCPHQFKLDKRIEAKFLVWAPVFMALLVDVAMETKGNVADCDCVKEATDEYREGQDYLAGFVSARIMIKKPAPDGTVAKLRKTDLKNAFEAWYIDNQGKHMPNKWVSKLYDYMNSKFPSSKQSRKQKDDGWKGLAIIDEDGMDDDFD